MCPSAGPRPWTRRLFLAGALATAAGGRRVSADGPGDAEALAKRLRDAGLKNVGTSRTAHFYAAGDAPGAFREEALGVCEKVAVAFQKQLKQKGFSTALPDRPMAVVALAGRESYAAFKKEPVGEADAGHYEIGEDVLVIFDFRGAAGAVGRRLNTMTLVHETIHQLTFDAGLLARDGDVPVAVSEGLATYGELWTQARPVMGQANKPRLGELMRSRDGWVGVERLLTDDTLFDNEVTVQAAYGAAWLLVHHLLRTPESASKLRAYLDLIRPRRDPRHRADDAAKALGDLRRLDEDLKRAARRLNGAG